MSSEISTREVVTAQTAGFQAWHGYLLLAMAGAIWAVLEAQDRQLTALLLLSAAVLAAGAVGIAIHYTVLGFLSGNSELQALDPRTRQFLEQEKAMVLRSIKELEFDRAMRKVSDADFAEIDSRLRARAITLMEQIEQAGADETAPSPVAVQDAACPSCGVRNDDDARFCKSCGQRLGNE